MFKWTGFICLMVVCLAIAFFSVVYAVYFSISKLKTIDIVFKRITKFYKTMPRYDRFHDYAVVVFDYRSGKFVEFERFKSDGSSEYEYEQKIKEMRLNFAKGGKEHGRKSKSSEQSNSVDEPEETTQQG